MQFKFLPAALLIGLATFAQAARADDVVDTIKALQQRIEEQTQRFTSHSEERPFHPHLTLGRVKNRPQTRRVGEAVEKLRDIELGKWTVTEVELMQSTLSATGSQHTRLTAVRLMQDTEKY